MINLALQLVKYTSVPFLYNPGIRTFHIAVRNNVPRGFQSDPGIGLRKSLYEKHDAEKLDEDTLEESENLDVMNVHKAYPVHKSEILKRIEYIERKIEYNKYFAEPNGPNMLTWAEKIQIKELHEQDPEEWTIDALSDTFPATRSTIVKVLKSRWKPTSVDEMKKSDKKTLENWKLLERGELEVSKDLLEHLNKFTSRREDNLKEIDNKTYLNFIEKDKEIEPNWNKGQMLDILNSYQRHLEKPKLEIKKPEISKVYLASQGTRKPKGTLDVTLNIKICEIAGYGRTELKEIEEKINEMNRSVTERVEQIESDDPTSFNHKVEKIEESPQENISNVNFSKSLSPIESEPCDVKIKANLDSCTEEKEPEDNCAEVQDIKGTFFWSPNTERVKNEVTKAEPTSQPHNFASKSPYYNYGYPEKISIPSDKKGSGLTYRVKDCFYDSDGEFLYRVPGFKPNIEPTTDSQ